MNKPLSKIIFVLLLSPFFVLAATSSFTVTQTVTAPPDVGPIEPKPVLTISNVVITASTTKADLTWQTSNSANCFISYGTTTNYDLGVVNEAGPLSSHALSLTGLTPSKTYHFQISCTDSYIQSITSPDYSFSTLEMPPPALPLNVIGLITTPAVEKITLGWQMPQDPSIVRVKIYRSGTFYPQSPSEGSLIYDSDGLELSYADNNLIAGKRYYYTAFSFNAANANSSGAVGDDIPLAAPQEEPVEPIVPTPEVPSEGAAGPGSSGGGMSPGSATSTKFLDSETKYTKEQEQKLKDLDFLNFDFLQGKDNLNSGKISNIKAGDRLEIEIDSTQIPDFVKSVLVMFEKDDKRFTFLLQKDTQGKLRSDLMVPLDKRGAYKVTIFLIDKDNNIVKKIQGEMEVLNPGFLRIKVPDNFWKKSLIFLINLSNHPLFWPSLIILAILSFLYRRAMQLKALRSMKRTSIEGGGAKMPGSNIALAPCNVLEFNAVSLVGSIMLTWKNPPAKFGRKIKIVRGQGEHIVDVLSGDLVYEAAISGEAEQFIDSTPRESAMLFYTAFVCDDGGQWSSGALAWAKPLLSAGESIGATSDLPYVKDHPALLESSLQNSGVGARFSDLSFFQNDQNIESAKGPIASASMVLEIMASQKDIPVNIKSVILELFFGGRKSFLLLGRNIKDIMHCSLFLPPGREGEFAVKVYSISLEKKISLESPGKIIITK